MSILDSLAVKELESQLAAERQRAHAGQRFKEFVHSYLDEHGVPHDDPENEHQKQGCRIGARLDLILASRAHEECQHVLWEQEAKAERQARQKSEERVRLLIIERDDFENQLDENILARNAAEEFRQRAEQEAAVCRDVLEMTLKDGKQESEKVWHGSLSHEAAVRVKAVLDGTAGRALHDFMERLRAAPCKYLHPNGCQGMWPDRPSQWCFTCQARSIGGRDA